MFDFLPVDANLQTRRDLSLAIASIEQRGAFFDEVQNLSG
jgi:hypothetical protein